MYTVAKRAHWPKYCSKFTTGTLCNGDTNIVNYQEYKERIDTPAPTVLDPNFVITTWKEIKWQEFFTNSDEVTCPTLECAFTQKQTSTVVPKESDYVQVLENQFKPYGRVNIHAGWKYERSIQCRTRDAYHDGTVAQFTKDWALTMKVAA
jgi:hypothetical protein